MGPDQTIKNCLYGTILGPNQTIKNCLYETILGLKQTIENCLYGTLLGPNQTIENCLYGTILGLNQNIKNYLYGTILGPIRILSLKNYSPRVVNYVVSSHVNQMKHSLENRATVGNKISFKNIMPYISKSICLRIYFLCLTHK